MPFKSLIELDKLKEHFHRPMADVARSFGVCTTFFKRICRTYGIKRWPFRKLQSIEKKMTLLRAVDTPQSRIKLAQLQSILHQLQSSGICPSSTSSKIDSTDDESNCHLSALIGAIGETSGEDGVRDLTDCAVTQLQRASHIPANEDADRLTQILGLLASRQSPPAPRLDPPQPALAVHDAPLAVEFGSEGIAKVLAGLSRESSSKVHPKVFKHDQEQAEERAVVIFEVESNGTPRYTYMSHDALEVYGLRPSQALDESGATMLSAIHEQDRVAFLSSIKHSQLTMSDCECITKPPPNSSQMGAFVGKVI